MEQHKLHAWVSADLSVDCNEFVLSITLAQVPHPHEHLHPLTLCYSS